MDDQSPAPQVPAPSPGTTSRRALWPLAALAAVAIVGAGAGAYFGLRGAAGPGSGQGTSPPARAFAAAAYDEASHQVVVFGGIGGEGSALSDTWTWDGSSWTQQHPATSPPGRAFAAMTYDPKAHDVVLVGGRSVTPPSPTVCSGGIAAGGPNATPGVFSPAACKASPPSQFSDTWVWNGSTWRLAAQAPSVVVGETPALGTDPTTGQVLMLAESPGVGMNPACPSPAPSFPPGTPIPQVAIPCIKPAPPSVGAWLWTGAVWTPLTAGQPPVGSGVPVGGFGALASDPTSGHLVDVRAGVVYGCAGGAVPGTAVMCPLVEGSSGAQPRPLATANAAIATPVPVPVLPAPPVPATVVPPPVDTVPMPMPTSVPAPGRIACCTDTVATWTGTAWSNARTFNNAPQVNPSGIAGDPARHDVVAVTQQGTWTWDGSTWKEEHPAASPPPQAGGALVYDGESGKLLLFGGEMTMFVKPSGPASQTFGPQVSDELWAWDGATWTQLSGAKSSPAPSPSPAPTFVPPSTPIPGSPAPTIGPLPTPSPMPCTPTATPRPTPTPTPTPTSTPASKPTPGSVSPGSSGFGCATAIVPASSG